MDKGNQIARQSWLKAVIAKRADGNVSDFSKRYSLDYTGMVLMLSGKRAISEKTMVKVANRTGEPLPEGYIANVGIPKSTEVTYPKIASEFGVPMELERAITSVVSSQLRMTSTVEDLVKAVDELRLKLDELMQHKSK